MDGTEKNYENKILDITEKYIDKELSKEDCIEKLMKLGYERGEAKVLLQTTVYPQ